MGATYYMAICQRTMQCDNRNKTKESNYHYQKKMEKNVIGTSGQNAY